MVINHGHYLRIVIAVHFCTLAKFLFETFLNNVDESLKKTYPHLFPGSMDPLIPSGLIAF